MYGLITANLSDDSTEALLTDLSMDVLEAFEFNGLNLHFNLEYSQKDSVALISYNINCNLNNYIADALGLHTVEYRVTYPRRPRKFETTVERLMSKINMSLEDSG